MEFLKQHQLDIMLVLSGICGIIAIFVLVTRTITKMRKLSLVLMEVGSMMLLIADRYAYIYRGDTSSLGYWMVRISNFFVYFMLIFVINAFNFFLVDVYRNEGNLKKTPLRLRITEILSVLGALLVVVSQFTDLFYYFDEQNLYQRSPLFFVCYIIPLIILLIQLSVIIKYRKIHAKTVYVSIILFTVLPIIASVIQFFSYGISLMNMTIVGLVVLLYIFILIDNNKTVERANKIEIEYLKNQQKNIELMFEQTAAALANAIDAKDKYTHGHSTRVAEYSSKIAKLAGKTEKECKEVYYSALLHDVGKIGIPDTIINKEGKLSNEEFAEIKKHPVIGKQILSSISSSPYLSIGANYHHERYDGKGYPSRLKGDDIPYIARIIAVADAYDAMASKRSYREPIPQQKVKEEIMKGMGTQFDPEYAGIMLRMIDLDAGYQMKERGSVNELAGKDNLICNEYRVSKSSGIRLTDTISKISLHFKSDEEFLSPKSIPSIILFDSLDERVHETESEKKDMVYFEYAEIRFDGEVSCAGARKIEVNTVSEDSVHSPDWLSLYKKGIDYEIEACKVLDHVQIKIKSEYQTITFIIALLDSARYAFISLTGEHCFISDVVVGTGEKVDESYIPRIADRISYIDGPEGDMPNVQIDDWCSDGTEGIPVSSEMKVSFRAKSLPTARLIWHCPYIDFFYSDNHRVNGGNYTIFELVRLDGEVWESDNAENSVLITKKDDFKGWDVWKESLKKGLDFVIYIKRKGNKIFLYTETEGISIESYTVPNEGFKDVFMSITGDQCTLTNIRIERK